MNHTTAFAIAASVELVAIIVLCLLLWIKYLEHCDSFDLISRSKDTERVLKESSKELDRTRLELAAKTAEVATEQQRLREKSQYLQTALSDKEYHEKRFHALYEIATRFQDDLEALQSNTPLSSGEDDYDDD